MTRSFKLPRRSMLLALACKLAGSTALAQDPFPSKSIRIVAAGAPGGGMDLLARVIGDHMQRTLKQPVIIDNRPGGNGVIAANAVLNAPADGYTLLLTAASFTVMSQAIAKKPAYDGTRDLVPVTQNRLGWCVSRRVAELFCQDHEGAGRSGAGRTRQALGAPRCWWSARLAPRWS